ncbi:MAG TPA: non-homologous end-joining DNA ligase [Candidatus Limnocylindrales bacterium]|nr:non-homologous end-joining DNA ligase [Candidatus Limnocylindrales bacterium]
MARKREQLEIEGRRLAVSNLDKVLYPGGRFRKGQVIDFYIRAADFLLPHLKDRPVTLKRFPDGVSGEHFYEKDAPSFTPEWVRTFPVPRRGGGPPIRYIVIDDLATLVWSADLANLEIHPFLHRTQDIQRPTHAVFDLDPGEGADVLTCARVALQLRDMLGDLGLQSLAKVSGSKGIQVYVPLNSEVAYDVVQPFAKAIAQLMHARSPDLVVADMSKALRTGKVLIDWSQNSDYKTTVGVYSLRAKNVVPFVSLPMTWEELAAALGAGDRDRLYFTPEKALRRMNDVGDLFEPVLTMRQELPAEVRKAVHARRTRRGRGSAGTERQLAAYNAKRDFRKTPEPSGAEPRSSRQGSRRRFVVQKHAASHLHYDFRLQMHGVLKSWSVPKGPPYKRDETRLAIATEDHPLDYIDFEGIIPKGQYGGGTVMVWDTGTYALIEGNYYKGFLHIHLDGRKLRGEWILRSDGDGRHWHLMRSGRSMKALTPAQDDASAVTGRSMQEIADAADATWQSNRGGEQAPAGVTERRPARATQRAARATRQRAAPATEPDLSGLPKARVAFVEPMLARLTARLPAGANWAYEIKLDGYRALGLRTARASRLLSRRGRSLEDRFGSIVAALDALPEATIVDGEVVVLDEQGHPSFAALQNVGNTGAPLHYYLFDLLAYRGRDLRGLPYSQRREILEAAVMPRVADPVRLSLSFLADAQQVLAMARKEGLEGIIAKRTDSLYEPGERSGAWLKHKTNQGQEMVIGGYMPGANGFDALLVGYYDGDRLMFAAKIRNGFVPALRRKIAQRFAALTIADCPFANLPEPANARRGEALTAEVMKKCRWLEPVLVARIDFTEWTRANHLRHARFVALRDDKEAREVVQEKVA